MRHLFKLYRHRTKFNHVLNIALFLYTCLNIAWFDKGLIFYIFSFLKIYINQHLVDQC